MNIVTKTQITPVAGPDTLETVIRKALRTEAEALAKLCGSPPDDLFLAAELIHLSTGPVIVAGVGKSGHIGCKIASTMRSLGQRATFLHAAEASHGDLGMIHRDSVVVVLSNSGETSELMDLLAYCRANRIPIVSITATRDSTLGRASQFVIAHGRLEEACVHGLAPTTSTTVALALGDALAVGISHLSRVEPKDFHRYHPGGKLGAGLTTVGDIMHTGKSLPVVAPSDPMQEVVITMSAKGFGAAIVCDGPRILGMITDGDMRRNVDRLWMSSASDLILGQPKTVAPETTIPTAVKLMNGEGITSVVVAGEDGALLGLLHIHDCLRTGLGRTTEPASSRKVPNPTNANEIATETRLRNTA